MAKRNPPQRSSEAGTAIPVGRRPPPGGRRGPSLTNSKPNLLQRGTVPGICLLLSVLVVWAFLPSIRNGFVNFDDTVYVYENPHVQAGLTWGSLRWAFTNLQAGFWHPVTWLSIMVDCQLFGLRAGGHHLTSLLLHAANTALLFLLFRRMTGATWRSALVAALFALHPLHVEPVAWAADRKDVLSALFWLLTMLFYVRYVQEPAAKKPGPEVRGQRPVLQFLSSAPYLLSLFFFMCGLMSKTMIVTLPLLLLLLDWWPLQRFQLNTQSLNLKTLDPLLLEKLPFLAAALGAGLLTVQAEQSLGAVAAATSFPMSDRVANAVLSYVRYLAQAAWPHSLAVFYPYPRAFSLWPVVGAALLPLAVSALIWWVGRTRPWLIFGWVWYVVSLLPVIGLIQVGSHARADRYTYVPLVGVFVMVVWAAYDLTGRWRHRAVALTTAASAVILVCTFLTHRQINLWRDTETLLRHTIAVTQDNTMAYNNLGAALASEGRLGEAIGLLQEAARLNPKDAGIQDNLGAALARQGRLDEAVPHLREAVRLNPHHAGAHNDLGAALGRQGRLDEASEQLQIAVKLAPGDAGAHCNLGDALAATGRFDDAVSHYQAAIKLNPDYAEAHCNLGLAMGRQGRLDEAIIHLQEAIRLKPDYTDAQNNLRAILNLKAAASVAPGTSAKP